MPDNNERVLFLGLPFDRLTMDEAVARCEEYVASRRPHMVFTPNAELIVRSQTEGDLAETYHQADMVTIDSHVAYYGARLLGLPLPEPVSAARLMFALLPVSAVKRYKFFLLGARNDVVTEVANKISADFPGINVVGFHDGYFKPHEEAELVAQIKASQADFLFVAMSTPFKERFVSKYLQDMNVPVCMGVGGTFDIIAGRTRFAPAWMSKFGLEWFYRFIQEPRRLWRRYLYTNASFIRLMARAILRGNPS